MSSGIFNSISIPKVGTSVFDLSEEMKLSCNIGDLVPICCKEILPKDNLSINTELLIKFAPLAAPVMHRIQAYVHYFFVPMEQICEPFKDFINPKVNTQNNIVLPYTSPAYISSEVHQMYEGSLADYLGLPVNQDSWRRLNSSQSQISILPFLAYQHIYNSYYRSEDLEPLDTLCDIESLKKHQGVVSSNVPKSVEIFRLRNRAWAKDYFTSALPSPQAGDDVLIPMEGVVSSDGDLRLVTNSYGQGIQGLNTAGPSAGNFGIGQGGSSIGSRYFSGLKVNNGSATINDLRKALALQRFKELAERGGTRYSEMVRNFFGAYLPDWYIDRPIFLGGSKQPINIGEVVQTSGMTDDQTVLGQRGGIASSYGKVKTAHLKAPCHGFLIGILSIRPVATYQQGLERMWTRKNMFDYPFPQFAHLGEQEILNQEIFASGDAHANNGIFGYTPRYSEWKEGHCHVAGAFRSSLSYWHFGRKFENLPTLSKEFVQMDHVSTEPFVVTDGQTEHVYVNLYNKITARRALPFFGTPSII